MAKQIIECVPNFSEGQNMAIIKQITDEIEKVEGVNLLDVDPGKATNRTVITFVGEPQQVIDAALVQMKINDLPENMIVDEGLEVDETKVNSQ